MNNLVSYYHPTTKEFLGTQELQNGVDTLYTSNICPTNLIRAIYDDVLELWHESATDDEIDDHIKGISPEIVSRRQLKLALQVSGVDMAQIETLIDSLQEPSKTIAKIAWCDAVTFDRTDALFLMLASQMNMNAIQIKDLFRLAITF